jgi:transposase-like protein
MGRQGLHSSLMTKTIAEENVASKNDQWRERIAEHERSGMSVRRFCKERGIAEHLFFYWRKRLRNQQQPMRFALVEREAARQAPATAAELELVLANGERLRIGTGVDATTLRTVLETLRA